MKHRYSLEGYSYRLRPVKKSDAAFIVEARLEDAARNQYIHPISENVSLQEAWLDRYFEREGDYYFISDYHKPFKNGTIELAERFTSKFDLPAGRYQFDAAGKMIINHGVVGDHLYINGELVCERDTCDTWDAENVHVQNIHIREGVNTVVLRLTRVNADAKYNLIFSRGATCATHVTHYASVNPLCFKKP